MREKDMVNDVLSMVNSSLTGYASVISQTSNQQLRQTIQQIRNHDEQFQYDLYKLAEQKGFYQPAQQADPKDIQQIKTQLSGDMAGGSEMTGRNVTGGGMNMGGVSGTGAEIGSRSRMDW
ncbi:MAG: Coat F domain protein [Pelotomaculum sp. PtaB.Bin013]|nr:MAG: Coat F domain protein [Pelotomaculum sp. PtaB.Bin013]